MGNGKEIDLQRYLAIENENARKTGMLPPPIELCLPPIVEALGPVDGLKVMDFGSGNGWLLRILRKEGALYGKSIERDRDTLAKAQQLTPDPNIKYVPDLEEVPFNSVDKIVSNLVLMESKNKAELRKSFQDVYDRLKPGGTFASLITHPAFIDRPFHDSRRDFGEQQFDYNQEGRQYGVVIDNPEGEPVTLYDHHYTLTTYMNLPVEVGFRFEKLTEVQYTPDFINKYYPGRTELLGYPPFLVWKGTKSGD